MLYYERPAEAAHMVILWCLAGEFMTKTECVVPRGYVFTDYQEALMVRKHFIRAQYVKLKRDMQQDTLRMSRLEHVIKEEGLDVWINGETR